MLPGPIFNVELITSARRARYYLARVAYGGALLVAFWTTCADHWNANVHSGRLDTTANLAAQFFAAFSWLQLIMVVALGPAIAAGTISSERQRRTIEYLFASTLSNSEIVLGKLLARLVHLFAMVLVGVPILALAMMLGGIAPQALLVLTVVTLSTALTVAVIAIAVSVWSPKPRDAISRAYLVLAALLLLPLLVYGLTQGVTFPGSDWIVGMNDALLDAHPFWGLGTALYGASSTSTGGAWAVVGTMVRHQMIVTAVCALMATMSVRRAHLRQASRPPRPARRLRARWRPALGDRPVLWKETFARGRGGLGLIGRLAVVLLVGGVLTAIGWSFFEYLDSGSSWGREMFLGQIMTFGTIVACATLLVLVMRAAASVTSEKEAGSWDMLIATPVPPGEVVRGKVFGNLMAMWPIVLLILGIWAFGLLADPGFILPIVFLLLTLLIIGTFGAALGVVVSLQCRTTLWAMGLSTAIGLFVGGLYMMCCCAPVMFAGPGPGGDGWAVVLAPCVPFLMAAPGMMYVEPNTLEHSPEMLGAYVMGVGGYLAAGAILMAAAIGNFDAWTGRTRARELTSRHPVSSTSAGPRATEGESEK